MTVDPIVVVIAQSLGISAQFVAAGLQAYSAFKRSNVEAYYKMLLDSKEDLTEIGKSPELQRYFLFIMEKAASEVRMEKIRAWAKVTVNLANKCKHLEHKDVLLNILDGLSYIDLAVLEIAYFSKTTIMKTKAGGKLYMGHSSPPLVIIADSIALELEESFEDKQLINEIVQRSVKYLASHGLVSEVIEDQGSGFGGGEPAKLIYTRNSLGLAFLEFASDYTLTNIPEGGELGTQPYGK